MIGYPNKKQLVSTQIENRPKQSYSGRGMSLEEDLNKSNSFYKESKRALIYKKPTPIQIVKVDYPHRSCAKIKEAYYKTPSTTDYNGIYKGKYIDFEAKETKNKTSIPLQNIHQHQIEHLQHVLMHGGIGFFIFRFSFWNITYLIDATYVIHQYLNQTRKSIPYEYIKTHGFPIKEGLSPRLNYLDVIDQIYFKEV